MSSHFASTTRAQNSTKSRAYFCKLCSIAWIMGMSASTQIIIATQYTKRGTQTQKQSGWHTCRFDCPLAQQNLISCRFTTCLDSRKTGHRVQQSVFEKDVKRYGWGLPECLRPVDEGHESKQNARILRGGGLGPFVLDTLKIFGDSIENSLMSKYKELGSQSGAAKSTTADHHLQAPYKQIIVKLSKMEFLPQVHVNTFVQEARKELRTLEKHVADVRSQWPGLNDVKKKSESTRKHMVDDLRRKFHSERDAPHLSLLGDVREIRASYAYQLCGAGNATFAFAMAFEVLCNIKARESGGTILDREFAELMAIPKIAVRTLSALRSQP